MSVWSAPITENENRIDVADTSCSGFFSFWGCVFKSLDRVDRFLFQGILWFLHIVVNWDERSDRNSHPSSYVWCDTRTMHLDILPVHRCAPKRACANSVSSQLGWQKGNPCDLSSIASVLVFLGNAGFYEAWGMCINGITCNRDASATPWIHRNQTNGETDAVSRTKERIHHCIGISGTCSACISNANAVFCMYLVKKLKHQYSKYFGSNLITIQRNLYCSVGCGLAEALILALTGICFRKVVTYHQAHNREKLFACWYIHGIVV